MGVEMKRIAMMADGGPGYRHGGYDTGRSMRWDDSTLDLTDEQRTGIAEIQKKVRHKPWELMEKMHKQSWRSGARDGKCDAQAARKTYGDMADMRKQMFENMPDERKRIDSVLTPQQREQIQKMHHGWGGR